MIMESAQTALFYFKFILRSFHILLLKLNMVLFSGLFEFFWRKICPLTVLQNLAPIVFYNISKIVRKDISSFSRKYEKSSWSWLFRRLYWRVIVWEQLIIWFFPGKIFCVKRPHLSETAKIGTITSSSWPRGGCRLLRGAFKF